MFERYIQCIFFQELPTMVHVNDVRESADESEVFFCSFLTVAISDAIFQYFAGSQSHGV